MRADVIDPTMVDEEAVRIRRERGWNLAVFVAVFDPPLRQTLMVQLGDYARARFGGHPWTLPGGSVEPDERPAAAACRELVEEAGLVVDPTALRPVGWFPRPNHRPHHREQVGELLLVYGGVAEPAAARLTPKPPETLAVRFVGFDADEWLRVPAHGEGEHPLQPLPRHWLYWAWLARTALASPAAPVRVWEYLSPASLGLPPWDETDTPPA